MRRSRRAPAVTLMVAVTLALATGCGPGFPGFPGDPGGPPGGPGDPVTVVATGLEGPFGISLGRSKVFVAENGANQVSAVKLRNGSTSPSVTGLLSPSGVAVTDHELAIVTGGSEVPDASITGDASLFAARPGGVPELVADLEEYELANNPDGQLQFDPDGVPLDALSNPFAVIAARGGHHGGSKDAYGGGDDDDPWVLVADGGANDVLAVTRSGEVSTFFVPPVVTTGDCEGRPNNDEAHTGCDPVPTGLAYGPDNTLYVSTLSGEAPGEGRVYVLDADTGEVRDVISGLDSPTGVAVREDGTVYVSEVLFGAPEGDGPPPEGFDPSTVGRLVRINPSGERTYAAVTMPLSLELHDGTLYASAWAIAGFLGISGAGQVVTVDDRAFS